MKFDVIAYRGTNSENDILFDKSINKFKLDLETLHPIWFSASEDIAKDYVENGGNLYKVLICSKRLFQLPLDNDDRIFVKGGINEQGKQVYYISDKVNLAFKLQSWFNPSFCIRLRRYIGGDIDEISVFDLLMYPEFAKNMINDRYDCISINKQGQKLDRAPDTAYGVLNPKIIYTMAINNERLPDEFDEEKENDMKLSESMVKRLYETRHKMTREERDDLIKKFETGIVQFIYWKKDGSMREATGTRVLDKIPQEFHSALATYLNDPRAAWMLPYYDIDKQALRQFHVANFDSIVDFDEV